jgi:hypothetical protein
MNDPFFSILLFTLLGGGLVFLMAELKKIRKTLDSLNRSIEKLSASKPPVPASLSGSPARPAGGIMERENRSPPPSLPQAAAPRKTENLYERDTPRPVRVPEPTAAPVSTPRAPERPVLPQAAPVSTPRAPERPALPQAAPPAEPPDEISPLYHSKESRDRRRLNNPGDTFMDITTSAYQRYMQGEQAQLTFEKGGSYVNSPYVLVDGKSLYLNFHHFNESRPVSRDREKVLLQIYEIAGSLTDFVNRCVPAQMVPSGEGYVVSRRGKLELDSGSTESS